MLPPGGEKAEKGSQDEQHAACGASRHSERALMRNSPLHSRTPEIAEHCVAAFAEDFRLGEGHFTHPISL